MKVLISEQQYKSIILEEVKKDVKSLMDTQTEIGLKAIQDARKWVGFDYKFLLTYAMGIGGLLPTVTKWLYNQEPTLDEAQVTALVISAISLVFFSLIKCNNLVVILLKLNYFEFMKVIQLRVKF